MLKLWDVESECRRIETWELTEMWLLTGDTMPRRDRAATLRFSVPRL